ncbi:MAG: hypothetical protein ACYCO5_10475 [Acidobacteriaceae bacterium]
MKGVFLLVIFAGIAGCCAWLLWPTGGSDQSQSAPPTAAQLKDAKYLSDRYALVAVMACTNGADDYLKSVARYDYTWVPDSELEGFDFRTSVLKEPGVLTVASDKAKLENGFGAFQRVKLFCDFDTQAKVVLGYSIVLPGN